jgi:hypothetical protein
VRSPQLAAAGAAWDDGPAAGLWIADRLGPWGPKVGSELPRGYEQHAIASIQGSHDVRAQDGGLGVLERLLDLLDPFTGKQPVHCGMWDGWHWWYRIGTDPRQGTGVSVYWPVDEPRPPQHELDRRLAEGRELVARTRVETPDAEPLEQPFRNYYLWTGPLRSALAFSHHPHQPPSLVWPEDQSWFISVPIYSKEIAIGGAQRMIDSVIAASELDARRASWDDVLDIDD